MTAAGLFLKDNFRRFLLGSIWGGNLFASVLLAGTS
jgi:hypothetical protein